jgi:hypothetical protein
MCGALKEVRGFRMKMKKQNKAEKEREKKNDTNKESKTCTVSSFSKTNLGKYQEHSLPLPPCNIHHHNPRLENHWPWCRCRWPDPRRWSQTCILRRKKDKVRYG